MIDTAIKFINSQLRDYLSQLGNTEDVTIGNLTTLQNENNNSIVISLINIEEESTLRNQKNYKKINHQLIRKSPPIFLNLFVMVAFSLEDYENSLLRMSQTIQFFQKNKRFTSSDYPVLLNNDIKELIFKLFTVDLEQLNDLWGILGGNYFPSVIYKVRLVEIEAKEPEGMEIPITDIKVDTSVN